MVEQIAMLRRHSRLIISLTLILPLFTSVILWLSPASYTATAVMLYDPSVPASTPTEPVEDEEAEIASQTAIITGLPALRDIALRQSTANDDWANSLWPFHHSLNLDDRMNAVRRSLSVYIPPNTHLLEVSFTSPQPDDAAATANFAVSLYLDRQRDQTFADLKAQQVWLQSQDSVLQTDLDKTEAALAAARGQAGQVAGMQGDLSAETASRITATLVDAQAKLAMATARLRSATTSDAAANAEVAPNLQPLRKEQADLEARVNTLSREYGSDYPDLLAARTSLAAINNEISAEAAREIDAARAEVSADQAAVTTLSASLDAARKHSQSQDTQSVPQQLLSEHADTDRAMLTAISVQSSQLAQAAALTRAPARLISAAVPPIESNRKHRSLTLAAASFFGLCSGILLAGIREALDTSFRHGADLAIGTGLSCLALLPDVKNPREAALEQPFGLFAEQMRALRTALALNDQARILVVTSARPGEGKTTLTASLGRSLAMAGVKVLVIDADIRQPSFDIAFCTRNILGLTDYLAGHATLDEVLQQDYRAPLAVLTAGTQTADALSLFLAPGFGELLIRLRSKFDMILIDAPPAFALAETQILANAADGVLFCVQWGTTPRATVQAALAILARSEAAFTGAILTRVDPKRHRRSGFADAEMYQPRFGGYFSE